MAHTVDTRRKMKMVVKIKNMVYLIEVSTGENGSSTALTFSRWNLQSRIYS
jgi:hypothetical protein